MQPDQLELIEEELRASFHEAVERIAKSHNIETLNGDVDFHQETTIDECIETLAKITQSIIEINKPCPGCGAQNPNKYCARGECNPT